MATTPTPVRQHILNALAEGFKYERAMARKAHQQQRRDAMKARIERAYWLATAHEVIATTPSHLDQNHK